MLCQSQCRYILLWLVMLPKVVLEGSAILSNIQSKFVIRSPLSWIKYTHIQIHYIHLKVNVQHSEL